MAVRLAGVVFWVFGAFDLIHVILGPLGVPEKYPVTTDLVIAGSWAILGLAATFRADTLTRLAYGKSK